MKLKPTINLFLIPILAVIALSIAYYLVIFLPSKEQMRNGLEKEKIRLEEQASQLQKNDFDTCIAKADENKDRLRKQRQEVNKSNLIPKSEFDVINDLYAKEQELCVKKYK